MTAFWNGFIFKDPNAEHSCEDFAVVLACNGEKDLLMCAKCGKGLIAPCNGSAKAKRERELFPYENLHS
jgi:hypothetical protein